MKDSTEWIKWPTRHVSEKIISKKKTARSRRNFKKKKRLLLQKADEILNNGSIRILVDSDIPKEAIVALGRGLGFVPTPNPDFNELRLDARRIVNKLMRMKVEKNADEDVNNEIADAPEEIDFQLPTKLRQPNYFLSSLTNPDPEINVAINSINANMNSDTFRKSNKRDSNLSRAEMKGLNWLKQKVSNDEIAICKGDKGGAILIVPPTLLSKKIEEKVTDPTLYEELKSDMGPAL